ncbi:T9SS type A sorting domain-containing protein [bacterium SCSIO 12741]|nr:T9SS type A sorting domain-containing protein [bacterium SCSIO 12741]
MKYLVSTLASLVFVFSASAQSAQWVKLNTGTTKDIYDIHFLSPDTGYIVGEDYLFKKTTDGGQTWKDLPTPTINEKPGNGGDIMGIDYHGGYRWSHLDSGLFLAWREGYGGMITEDEGASYIHFAYDDSNMFCSIRGFRALDEHGGNGYVNLITYGESCGGNGVYYNYYNGPFGFPYADSTPTAQPNVITSVDRDSFITIFGHSDGYLRKERWVTAPLDSLYLDSTGITAVHAAGNGTWYAATNSGLNNMYRSDDSGSTFYQDPSFPQTFHYPQINDMSFVEPELGIAAGISNGRNGVIMIRDSSGWFFLTAEQPLNKAKLFDNGVGYVAGENGLMMRTGAFPPADTLGIRELHLNQLSVYPNPVESTFYLENLNPDLEIHALQLVQMTGSVVKSFDPSESELDVSDVPQGVYFLVLNSGGYRVSHKVVKR